MQSSASDWPDAAGVHCLPVQDSVVRAAVGWTKGSDFWAGMRELMLTAEDGAIQDRLRRIREVAGVSDRYTDLRTFDIVVWVACREKTTSD